MGTVVIWGEDARVQEVDLALGGDPSIYACRLMDDGTAGGGLEDAALVVVDGSRLSAEEAVDRCMRVRELRPDVPVLVLTPEDSPGCSTLVLRAGADDCVPPECSTESLAGRIRAHLKLAECSGLDVGRGFYEAIVNSIDSGILVVDVDQRILFANPYAARWLGASREELAGASFDSVSPELARCLREGQSIGEEVCQTWEGKRPVGFRIFPLRQEVRLEPEGWILLFTDLSRLVELRRKLRLRERLAAVGSAVGRIAHEVRNPLFAITGASQILSSELELEPKQRALFDTLLEGAGRLNRVVQELLDYSAEPTLSPAWIDVGKEIDSWLQETERSIRGKALELSVDVEAGTRVRADRQLLRTAFLHLVRNAVDASPRGGDLAVRSRCVGDSVQICVEDGGPGFPGGLDEEAWGLFLSTKPTGRGLGLMQVRKITEAHGGSLDFSDRPGGGTEAVLTLPRDGMVA